MYPGGNSIFSVFLLYELICTLKPNFSSLLLDLFYRDWIHFRSSNFLKSCAIISRSKPRTLSGRLFSHPFSAPKGTKPMTVGWACWENWSPWQWLCVESQCWSVRPPGSRYLSRNSLFLGVSEEELSVRNFQVIDFLERPFPCHSSLMSLLCVLIPQTYIYIQVVTFLEKTVLHNGKWIEKKKASFFRTSEKSFFLFEIVGRILKTTMQPEIGRIFVCVFVCFKIIWCQIVCLLQLGQ